MCREHTGRYPLTNWHLLGCQVRPCTDVYVNAWHQLLVTGPEWHPQVTAGPVLAGDTSKIGHMLVADECHWELVSLDSFLCSGRSVWYSALLVQNCRETRWPGWEVSTADGAHLTNFEDDVRGGGTRVREIFLVSSVQVHDASSSGFGARRSM